jgi:hypothetical protein
MRFPILALGSAWEAISTPRAQGSGHPKITHQRPSLWLLHRLGHGKLKECFRALIRGRIHPDLAAVIVEGPKATRRSEQMPDATMGADDGDQGPKPVA